jgi:hypothetical protein
METVWEDFSNITKDISILDKPLYSNLYTSIYTYIITSSKNKTMNSSLFSTFFYKEFKNNITRILTHKLNKYSIISLESFNNNYKDYFGIINKTNNIFSYFDKRIQTYNKIHFSRNMTYNQLATYLWNEFIKNKMEIINRQIESLLYDFRTNSLLDFQMDDCLDDVYIYMNLTDNNSDFITTLSEDFYTNYLDNKELKFENILFIFELEDELYNNLNYSIDNVIDNLIDYIVKYEILSNMETITFEKLKKIFGYLVKYNLISRLCDVYKNFLNANIELIQKNGYIIEDICEFYKLNKGIIYDTNDDIKKIFYKSVIELIGSENFIENYAQYFFKLLSSKKIDNDYITIIKYMKNSEIFQTKLLETIKNYILRNYNNLYPYFIENIKNVAKLIISYENMDIAFRLNKIVEDLIISRKLQNIHYNNNYNILIISDGIWNINYDKTHDDVPIELINKNNNINSTYEFMYNEKRKLTHCYNLYTAEVDYHINNKTYKFILPYKLVIFLCKFNTIDSVPILEDNNKDIYMRLLLRIKLIIIKDGNYILNPKFSYKKRVINFLNVKPKKINKNVIKEDEIYDHDNLVQCYIMKWLKQKKEDNFDNIYNSVKRILEMKIKIDSNLVSKNIEKLIELEFILESGNKIYNYN